MTAAPDLLVPVVGFRAWRIVGGLLMSPYIPCRWDGRLMHAACYDANRRVRLGRGWKVEPHASPDPDCQCGIYAYHRPGVRQSYGEFDWCEGIISAWGRLEAHADGLRAEHARLEVLALPRDPAVRRAVEAIAGRLGVPTCPGREQLADLAPRFGAPIPAALLPGA
jgi:hypothetical protein